MERIQHTRHRSSQQGALSTFLILVVVLAVVGWLGMQKSDRLVDLKHAIAGYLDKVDLTGKKPRQFLAEIETELSTGSSCTAAMCARHASPAAGNAR